MITVLGPNMGSNALGRALVLAQLVDRLGHPVQIVGSLRKNQSIWGPAQDHPIPVKTFPLYRQDHYFSAARALHHLTRTSEVVIISKSSPTSVGLALMAGIDPERSILDIDDWELGFRLARYQGSLVATAAKVVERSVGALFPWNVDTDLGVWLSESVAPLYPHRTVSNRWLSSRFGGHVVRHARDETELDPAQTSGIRIRQTLGVTEDRVWVGFIGTPRTHKGVDVLIQALALCQGANAPGLMLFGFDDNQSESVELMEMARQTLGEERLRVRGFFPLSELAEHVAAPDIIVVPSLDSDATRGQIPAKLFDAMAMAKAVIVSDVNDMPHILGDAGVVVPASNPGRLAEAIDMLASDAPSREAVGRQARLQFLKNYSFEACAEELSKVLNPLLYRA